MLLFGKNKSIVWRAVFGWVTSCFQVASSLCVAYIAGFAIQLAAEIQEGEWVIFSTLCVSCNGKKSSSTVMAPLVINQAVASCGCTVPSYPKAPIKPGEKGEIKITYNGKGKFPGHFKKTITIRTNATTEMTRLYVEGVMEEAK